MLLGTMMQLWLKGTHPSISEGVKTMTLCLRTDDGCCKMIKTIKVQKCKRNYKEFYVYELLSADGCPMAYCAGNDNRHFTCFAPNFGIHQLHTFPE